MSWSLAKHYRALLEEELDAIQYRAAVADDAELPLSLGQIVVLFGTGHTPKCTARIVQVFVRYPGVKGQYARMPRYQYTLKLPSGNIENHPCDHIEPIYGERMEALRVGSDKRRQLYDIAKASIESGAISDLTCTVSLSR